MSATITLTPAERVAAGAAWLDEHEPGWAERVNLDQLVMHDCDNCVLGQVFGRYYWVVDMLSDDDDPAPGMMTHERAVSLGFNLVYGETYRQLADAWRTLITQRRAET